MCCVCVFVFFFFNDTATTEIYTLSLHDALPIYPGVSPRRARVLGGAWPGPAGDRKSTRLNSSHLGISYAVFCLEKKKNDQRCLRRLVRHPLTFNSSHILPNF